MAVPTTPQLRRFSWMGKAHGIKTLDDMLQYLDLATGVYRGPIALDDVTDTLSIGSQADVTGSGIAISSSRTGALKVYSDDVGASIASSVRGALSRFLLTVDQAGGTIRALQGQLKMATGVDVTTGIYTALQGYVEMAGTHVAQTGATFSAIDASVEITTSLTVDSGGEACGIHVETTGAGTITNNGTCAGILVTNASGAASWPIALYINGADVALGFGSDTNYEDGIKASAATPAGATTHAIKIDVGGTAGYIPVYAAETF